MFGTISHFLSDSYKYMHTYKNLLFWRGHREDSQSVSNIFFYHPGKPVVSSPALDNEVIYVDYFQDFLASFKFYIS